MNIFDQKLLDVVHAEKVSIGQVQQLIAQGANVNAVDNTEESVLTKAIMRNRAGLAPDVALIKCLIEAGADVNYTGSDGLRVLYHAILSKQPEVVRMLLAYGANPNVVDKAFGDTILDGVEFDLRHLILDESLELEKLEAIHSILLEHGAKPSSELEVH